MIIYNFNQYIFEAETKKIVLSISDRLDRVLKSINDPISNAILNAVEGKQEDKLLSGSDYPTFDISFLDCELNNKEKIDKISFLPASKAIEGVSRDPFSAKGRQEMAVGRVVNRLFPEKFKHADVDKFINSYKAALGGRSADFRLVEGEDIRYWYLNEHYESNQGDLNSSCMREKKAQTFFDIYVNNPEHCKLLILMGDKDKTKIKGRALVWFNLRKPTGKVYMDRIYTIHKHDEKLYIEYAKERGWLYKAEQCMHDASYIEDGKRVHSSVSVNLKPVKYEKYPSLDTFCYYTPDTGRLASNPGNLITFEGKKFIRYHLNSTDGGARKLD